MASDPALSFLLIHFFFSWLPGHRALGFSSYFTGCSPAACFAGSSSSPWVSKYGRAPGLVLVLLLLSLSTHPFGESIQSHGCHCHLCAGNSQVGLSSLEFSSSFQTRLSSCLSTCPFRCLTDPANSTCSNWVPHLPSKSSLPRTFYHWLDSDSILPFAHPKPLHLPLLTASQTPCPVFEKIPLTVPSEYSQDPATSHHLHHHRRSLPGCSSHSLDFQPCFSSLF